MTKPEFLTVMAYLEAGKGCSKPVSRAQAEIYWDFFGAVSAQAFQAAAKLALSEGEFPILPSVATLLRHINRVTGVARIEDRAIDAYQEAADAARRLGSYASVLFADPFIHPAVRSLGSWQRFCEWPSSDTHWRQKAFLEAYAREVERGYETSRCRPLVGMQPGSPVIEVVTGLEIPNPPRIDNRFLPALKGIE